MKLQLKKLHYRRRYPLWGWRDPIRTHCSAVRSSHNRKVV